MNTIEFRKVSKSYDGKHNVINELDLIIPSGQRTILLGPSGCGKTTMLRMIAGLESISDGDLYMGGRLVNDVEPGDRNVAMVFQNYALYPHMTVENNILFGMQIAKVDKRIQEERLKRSLEILGLTPYRKRYPKELSGGQRQRVALCRALVKKSPYFLLDEPLSNLDAKLRTSARAELVAIHKVYEPTFVYVTHDQVEAMTVGEKIVVLDKSVIQQYDTPNCIYNRPANVFVAGFIGSPSMNISNAQISDGALVLGSFKYEIPDMWKRILKDREEIKVGIRPEHINLAMNDNKESIEIHYVEDHGNKKCINFSSGGFQAIATTEPSFRINASLSLEIDWSNIHFFDASTDLNLGYPDSYNKKGDDVNGNRC